MRVDVIVHPGKVGDRDAAQARLAALAEATGHDPPRWVETTAEDPGPGQACAALADEVDMVMVWGGDGTMIGVAAELADTGVPLAILPGGTGKPARPQPRDPAGPGWCGRGRLRRA